MHILKRILLLCFMGAGVQALRSQPAPVAQDTTPKDGSGQQAGQKVSSSSSGGAVVSDGAPMDAQTEQKARDLLRSLTAAPTPPKVGAAPPEVNERDAAREKALAEVRRMSQTNAPAAPLAPAPANVDREKELSRIESEIEASRKAHGQTNAPVRSSAPTNPPLIGGVLASPAEPTLTPAAEKRARDLLKQETIVIYSDNPTPQPVKNPERSTLPIFNQKPAAAPAAPASSAAARPVQVTAQVAPSAASAPAAPSTGLNATDEEKAREVLRQTLAATPAAGKSNQDPNTGRSNVLPPAATPSLDLPPAPAGSSAAAPKPTVVQVPPTTPPAPEPVPAPVTSPVVSAAPAPSISAEQEALARRLLEQTYAQTPAAAPTAPAPVPPVAPVPPTPQPAPAPATTTAGQSFTVTVPVAPAPATAHAPAAPTAAMTPEQEAKAREVLSQQAADLAKTTAPAFTPAPTVVTTAPSATSPTTPAANALPTSPAPATLSADQEAAARELVNQQIANLGNSPSVPAAVPAPAPAVQPTPATPVPPLVTSPVVPAVAAPAPVVAPAPAATPIAVVATPPSSLTPEQEAAARAALEQAEKQLASIPSTQNAPHVDSAAELKAKRELIKQQEREGKKRRAAEKKIEEAAAKQRLEQEAKMKKELDRLNREEQAKAKVEARKQLEAEAKARQQEARVRPPVVAETSAVTPVAAAVPAPAVSTPTPAPVEAVATPVVVKTAPPVETRSKSSAVPAGAGLKTKQQRLEDLTQAYVHDKISAQDYYRERSKILAEPGE